MTDKEIIRLLLIHLVQRTQMLRQVEKASTVLRGIDLVQHEAKYQRVIKDCGLEEQAKEFDPL